MRVGRAVSEELSQRHEVIRVGRTRGDYQVDITSQESVEALFAQTWLNESQAFQIAQKTNT
ncbi:hypothetical protein FK521_28100, partial [Klebsiella pneumoniae]|nr:hypothetical protein [Klebsiella pneumoniae]